MIPRTRITRRPGATTVEFALVAPIMLLILLGLLIAGLGVARYQEVAFLAREGARYASTHGAQYRADVGLPVGDTTVWTADIRSNGVNPLVYLVQSNLLTVTASWSAGDNRANAANANTTPPFTSTIPNVVTVTVNYNWTPELPIFGPGFGTIALQSTASMPMTY